MVHEGCWVNCQTTVENLEELTVCLRESAWRVKLSGNQAAYSSRSNGDLMLSQEDKPNRHRPAREISHETAILRSSVYRIIHRDLQLKCFKRCCVQQLSEANRFSHLTRW